MKIEEIDTVNLPSYAIVYLEYGDHSGLNNEDIRAIDDWREKQQAQCKGQLYFEYSSDTHFSASPEFGLPSNCVDCKIIDIY